MAEEGVEDGLGSERIVMAYMEYKVDAQETECERVANNCYFENAKP